MTAGVGSSKISLYKHGPGLPRCNLPCKANIYQKLSEKSLVEKCLHGKTQKQNEPLNGLTWQRIPKEVFVHKDTLELGAYDAIYHFNMDFKAITEF